MTMTESLQVVPSQNKVRTGVRDPAPIAGALADLLADTYRLTFKTHGCHWNVEGPLFYSIHKLTEEQYEDMFSAADALAERIRALGHLAPTRLPEILERSVVTDPDGKLSAGEMAAELAADHERVAHRLHALVKIAEDQKDDVTADLAIARSAFHEKAAWMLRAIAAE